MESFLSRYHWSLLRKFSLHKWSTDSSIVKSFLHTEIGSIEFITRQMIQLVCPRVKYKKVSIEHSFWIYHSSIDNVNSNVVIFPICELPSRRSFSSPQIWELFTLLAFIELFFMLCDLYCQGGWWRFISLGKTIRCNKVELWSDGRVLWFLRLCHFWRQFSLKPKNQIQLKISCKVFKLMWTQTSRRLKKMRKKFYDKIICLRLFFLLAWEYIWFALIWIRNLCPPCEIDSHIRLSDIFLLNLLVLISSLTKTWLRFLMKQLFVLSKHQNTFGLYHNFPFNRFNI